MMTDCAIVTADAYVDGARFVDTTLQAVWNPARRREMVGVAAQSDSDLVDRTVRAAANAASAWSAAGAEQRILALKDAVAAAADNVDERARLLTREHGKVLWESRVDVAAAPCLLDECSHLVDRVLAAETIDDGRGRFVRRRQPVGVVAVIVPWNCPITLALSAIAPALAAGNTVVVKPSELAPLALTAVSAIAKTLPAGVVNVIPGTGEETGAALRRHPLVRRVITPVALALGGNDPAVILESASVNDDLAARLRDAAFVSSGQVCLSIKRIYVHQKHYRALVDALRSAIDQLTVGDGLDPASAIGPLINEEAVQRVSRLVEDCRNRGATVEELGGKVDPRGWEDGNFVLPHLVSGIAHGSPLVAAEQSGPVLPVVSFDNDAQAVAMANDSECGLAASVWSADDDHASCVAAQIQAGTVFVNVHHAGASDYSTPYRGMKQSGIGRINGWASIEELTETQLLIRRDDQHLLPGPPR